MSGIGGVFLATSDVPRLVKWYSDLFHYSFQDFGDGTFGQVFGEQEDPQTWVIFSIMQAKGDVPRMPQNDDPTQCYGDQPVLVNLKVPSVVHFMDHCKSLNVPVLHSMNEAGIGQFCWVRDPDGNRVEVWQPAHAELEMV